MLFHRPDENAKNAATCTQLLTEDLVLVIGNDNKVTKIDPITQTRIPRCYSVLESANTDLALEWAVERVTHGAFEWTRLQRVPHTDVNRFKGDERDSAGNYYSATQLTHPPVSLLRMWITDIYHLLYVLALRKKGKTVLCFGSLAEHLFTTG